MYKHILLVDDDLDDTEIFEEALSETNSAIIFYSAENGQDALDKLTRQEIPLPGLIFLDVNMPGMGGWQLLSLLKSNPGFHHIPVIMYSTSNAKKDLDIADNLGAAGFLTKPADYSGLKRALAIILEQPTLDGLRQSMAQIKDLEKR